MNDKRSTRTLMAQISQIDRLMAAWKKVRANKGAAGVDLVTIQHFEANLYANLQALAESLGEERYYPLPLKRFEVPKPDGRTRPLAILAVEDRILQRAVLDALEPMIEAKFFPCSHGGFAQKVGSGLIYSIFNEITSSIPRSILNICAKPATATGGVERRQMPSSRSSSTRRR